MYLIIGIFLYAAFYIHLIICILWCASLSQCSILYIFYALCPVLYIFTIVETRWRQTDRPTLHNPRNPPFKALTPGGIHASVGDTNIQALPGNFKYSQKFLHLFIWFYHIFASFILSLHTKDIHILVMKICTKGWGRKNVYRIFLFSFYLDSWASDLQNSYAYPHNSWGITMIWIKHFIHFVHGVLWEGKHKFVVEDPMLWSEIFVKKTHLWAMFLLPHSLCSK